MTSAFKWRSGRVDDVAHHGLGALGELVDALGPEALVFGGLASDGEASVYGGDVVIAAFEGHCG